jgi:hypothetical protein
MPDDDDDNPLAIELKQEKAAAYFAICKKMLAAIEALQAFDRNLPLRDATLQQKARRSELLADAAELVFFFVIQREAMKFPLYEGLFDDYGIPEEVRKRMGPRKSR